MVRPVTTFSIRTFLAAIVLRSVLPTSLPAADPSDVLVRPDTCVVEFNLPPNANLAVDGKNYGAQRTLRFQNLDPNRTYTSRLIVSFQGDKQTKRNVLVRGGQRVHVALADPRADYPSVVLQTGHSENAFVVTFSPDGRYVASAASDPADILLWEVSSGRKLRQFEGHAFAANCLAFSMDGERIVSGSDDGTVRVWEAATGKSLRVLRTRAQGSVYCVAISRDGRYVVAGGFHSGGLRVWDIANGRELWHSEGYTDWVRMVEFSPDGRRILSACEDRRKSGDLAGSEYEFEEFEKPIRHWDAISGRPLGRFDPPGQQMYSVAFSKSDDRVFVATRDTSLGLWDLASVRKVDRADIHIAALSHPTSIYGSPPSRVLFSPDGHRALWQVEDKSVSVWDVAGGRELRRFDGYLPLALSHDGGIAAFAWSDGIQLWDMERWTEIKRLEGNVAKVNSLGISPQGDWLVCTDTTNKPILDRKTPLYLWNVNTGCMRHRLEGHESRVARVVFSPDSRLLGSSGTSDKSFRLWDVETGRNLYRRDVDFRVADFAFAPNGRTLFAGVHDEDLPVWDVATGQQNRILDGDGPAAIKSVAGSPDGRYVAAGRWYGDIQMWDVASGRIVRRFKEAGDVDVLAFSPDGKMLASSGSGLRLWNVETGKELRRLSDDGHARAMAFSPDGRLLTTTDLSHPISLDGFHGLVTAEMLDHGSHNVLLWDTRTGLVLHQLKGHRDYVDFVAFSNSGQTLMSGNEAEGLRLWDVATGSNLARVDFLKSNEFLITTPEGLFDGPEGARNLVGYAIANGREVVPVDRFFQDFYYPGLMGALLRGERPLPGRIIKLAPPPLVRIVSPLQGGTVETAQVTLRVEVADQGGGVQGPWLTHNGATVPVVESDQHQGKPSNHTLQVTLVNGENHLEVHAASADGAWESEPAALVLRYDKPLDQPELHVLAIGVADYRSDAYDLKFAAGDADAMGKLFEHRGKSLYKEIHVSRVVDSAVTKSSIRDELNAIAKQAEPQDTLIVFLAGHGVTLGQRFYFLPHDFSPLDKTVEEDIRAQGLPADVLGEWISTVPALKRVLIFDTCQSASALGLAGLSRDPFALRGAIERLSRAQGVFTIVAGDAEAYEVKELQHGLLTYTLLAGFGAVDRGPLSDKRITPSNAERLVDVLGWFSFASNHVPDLTEHYVGKIHQVQTAGHGMSFPILPLDEPRQD